MQWHSNTASNERNVKGENNNCQFVESLKFGLLIISMCCVELVACQDLNNFLVRTKLDKERAARCITELVRSENSVYANLLHASNKH